LNLPFFLKDTFRASTAAAKNQTVPCSRSTVLLGIIDLTGVSLPRK